MYLWRSLWTFIFSSLYSKLLIVETVAPVQGSTPFSLLLIDSPKLSSSWINSKITQCVCVKQNSKTINEHILPATISLN